LLEKEIYFKNHRKSKSEKTQKLNLFFKECNSKGLRVYDGGLSGSLEVKAQMFPCTNFSLKM
jgi:hypothetical protein